MFNQVEVIAVATITILAVISPGADFAMVTRNSIIHGRSAGLLSSLGIAAGVQLHVFYTMVGVGILIRNSPALFTLIKIAGAFYLVYVGYKTFFDKPTVTQKDRATGAVNASLSSRGAFKNGFFTNALNPKTTLFVMSVYTQVVGEHTPMGVQILYGAFMSAAHWAWFSMVSLFLSEDRLRNRLLEHQMVLNKGIGLILGALGILLSVTSVSTH